MASEPDPDLTVTIEACYRVEQSRREWLQGVLAALAWLGDGLGMLGFCYAVDANLCAVPELVVDCDLPAAACDSLLQAALASTPRYLTQDVGVLDGADCLFVSGRNSDRHNAVIVARRSLSAPTTDLSVTLARIAGHLATGARLQRRFELCRAWPQHDHDHDHTLGDLSSHAHPSTIGSVAANRQSLSAREHEIMVAAARGHSNKEIAFALGIAPSTIRVLLARAAKKLGVRDRRDAVRRFASDSWSRYGHDLDHEHDHGSSVGSG